LVNRRRIGHVACLSQSFTSERGAAVNKLFSIALVSAFSLGSLCAYAADMSNDERSELRQRAETFQAERNRNPEYQPGAGRLNPQPATAEPKQRRAGARAKAPKQAKAQKTETRRQKAGKRVRSLKNIPGAFVRK
jgi:hypothetical protein